MASGHHSWWTKYRSWFLFSGICVAIGVSGTLFVKTGTQQLLEQDARIEAEMWASRLAERVSGLSSLAVGQALSKETLLQLRQIQTIGRIYEFTIYDAKGYPQYRSTRPDGDWPIKKTLLQEYPQFSSDLEAGRAAVISTKGGDTITPSQYSVAINPLRGGKVLNGWLETKIDQADRASLYMTSTTKIAAGIGLLLALGPAIGFWYRTRQKEKAERQLAYVEHHDALTGCLNKASWLERLSSFVAGGSKLKAPAAVMHVHVEGITTARERFGNLAVDHLVRTCALRLAECLPAESVLARIGEERFAILLTHADAILAAKCAKLVTHGLADSVDWQGHSLKMQPAVGIALFPEDGTDPTAISKAADIALGLARQNDGSEYRFFDASIEQAAAQQRDLEKIVAEACDENYLHLNFQPVYDLRSGKLSGFEALLRLRHPEKGLISPLDFIPAAERTGVIDKIGAWVLEEACGTAVNWPADITLAVNLSPLQFESGNLVTTLRRILEKTRFPAYQLELEITEGLLLADSDMIKTQLDAMSDMGVRIILDDFGTGYSSFNYIWKFPFSKIKIDQSFVRAMEENPSVRGIVRTIILMGRSLGLPVTAEGIETMSQAAILKRLRCDLGQGYLFSRPVPSTEVAALILRNFATALAPPAAAQAAPLQLVYSQPDRASR